MPKVSVIIPIYGVEKYIERCARSLFEQTLDDIEYLFVDDCTPDKSIEILERIIDEYQPRLAAERKVVRIERMPTNSGLPAVRRHGIQLCTGDYVIHCDSDDWVSETMYKELYDYAVCEKSDLVFCDYFVTHENEENCNIFKKCLTSLTREYIIRCLLTSSALNPVWTLFAKRSLYKDFVMPIGSQTEDKVIAVQLVWKSVCTTYYPHPLYFYRQTPGSITNRVDKESLLRRYNQSKDNINIIIDYLTKEGVSTYFEDEIDALKVSLDKYLYKRMTDGRFRKNFKQIKLPFKVVMTNKYLTVRDKIIYLYMTLMTII